jgi:hypothetical protein
MRKELALVTWTRRQIVVGICLGIMLALLAVGGVQTFVSSSIQQGGAPTAQGSLAGDRAARLGQESESW